MTKKTEPSGPTIEEIRARRKPRRQEVDIPLDGGALAELERLQKELARVERDDERLNRKPEAPAIRRQIEELQDRIGDAFATFVFQQLPKAALQQLIDEHPPPEAERDKLRFDERTFGPALIAACCVQPKLTPEVVEEMFADPDEGWGEPEYALMFGAAWMVNQAATRIPFGVRGSGSTNGSGPSSTTAAPEG